jgi:exosome complex RNA-binding protein Rrp42 (RNase PH superfamily)
MEDLSWLNEAEQIRTFAKNSVRIDGRSFADHRKVSCKTSIVRAEEVIGSAQVQIGGTVVICGINLKVGTPTADAPDTGEIGAQLYSGLRVSCQF